jgi:S1-C subfamily serine protease
MKKNICLMVILILAIFKTSAQEFINKAEFQKYLDKNSQSLDQIEGIYSLNVKGTWTLNGELIHQYSEAVKSEWGVKRIDKTTFAVYDLGNNRKEESGFSAKFEKTSIDGVYTYICKFINPYWEARANVILTDGKILEYGYYRSVISIQNELKERYIPGTKCYWDFTWLKTYPINSKNDNTSKSTWEGNGSGFFIDGNGYIATNYHVIDGASEIEVDFIKDNQKQSCKAKIISSDKQNDLAIIKIEDDKFKPYIKLPYFFKSTISDVGSNVFALGYPMALTVMGEEVKFTDGKISSKTGFQGDLTTYQISVPVQPGNSGGPLFDYDGNIIGIVNAKIMAADNVSYAIKLTYLKNLIDVIPDKLILPSDISISQKTLTEKIKVLSNYVVLIKTR